MNILSAFLEQRVSCLVIGCLVEYFLQNLSVDVLYTDGINNRLEMVFSCN